MAVDSTLTPLSSGEGRGLDAAQDFSYDSITVGVSCLISNQQDGRPCLSRRPVQCVYYLCELEGIKSGAMPEQIYQLSCFLKV